MFQGLYSYLASYLLLNQDSVDDLLNRIDDPTISVRNFRPNIVVEGTKRKPFAEDTWEWIRIGEVVFRNVRPCTRCMVTTINPDTAVKTSSGEPLKTLKS